VYGTPADQWVGDISFRCSAVAHDDKTLEVNVHVEDPGAFTTPWNAIQRYRHVTNGPMVEISCPENNGDHFHHGLDPMPQAEKADF
jgi:hypothetical protein